LEGISEQIEQAEMPEDGCDSENDNGNPKAVLAGNHALFC